MHTIPEGLRKQCPWKTITLSDRYPWGCVSLVFLSPPSLFRSRTVPLVIIMFWININDVLSQTGSFIGKTLIGLTCWRITDFWWFLLDFPEDKGYENDLIIRPWEEHDDIITYIWSKLGSEYLGFVHSLSYFASHAPRKRPSRTSLEHFKSGSFNGRVQRQSRCQVTGAPLSKHVFEEKV